MILALTASQVSPQRTPDIRNGNGLLEACGSDEGGLDSGLCVGYIEGATDGLDVANDVLERRYGVPRPFCVPAGATVGQRHDIVVKYLKDNPDKRHNESALLIGLALHEAWPCSR
jgi:Rap1a immunity proteins